MFLLVENTVSESVGKNKKQKRSRDVNIKDAIENPGMSFCCPVNPMKKQQHKM